jgi:hypothetical protein
VPLVEAPFTPAVSEADVAAEAAYISGVNSDGTVASTSFFEYYGQTPVTWTGTTGQGATITYALDPSVTSSAGTTDFVNRALALWSAVASITFTPIASTDNPELVITSSGNTGGQAGPTALGPENGGFKQILAASGAIAPEGGFSDPNRDAGVAVHELAHAFGLGHAGPYGGADWALTRQLSQFDTQAWSIMSYFMPWETAPYQQTQAAAGANWYNRFSVTPMPADILALQTLYGAPTNSPLSGGQVFGFNSNITGALGQVFDFSQNHDPFLTLYDTGTGNTLDLSGYSTTATIDLRPGHFSSFDGWANNLVIAFGTAIDTAVGTTGGTSFYTNSDSDTIKGEGAGNTVYFPDPYNSYTLSSTSSPDLTVTSDTGSTYTLTDIQQLVFSDRIVELAPLAAPTVADGNAVVDPGQTTVIGTVAPGLAGEALTLTQALSSWGTVALGPVQPDGTQQILYTAPASVASLVTDSVSYTIADPFGDVSQGTATVLVDTGPVLTPQTVPALEQNRVFVVAHVKPGDLPGDWVTMTQTGGSVRSSSLTSQTTRLESSPSATSRPPASRRRTPTTSSVSR